MRRRRARLPGRLWFPRVRGGLGNCRKCGEACSGIWPGLTNSSLGRGPLPGSSLSHPDLAVVRCVNGERVPQATHRGHGRTPKDDPYKPPLPRVSLYEHNENDTHSWLLAQPSRTYRSSQLGVRAGADYTRWTLPDNQASPAQCGEPGTPVGAHELRGPAPRMPRRSR